MGVFKMKFNSLSMGKINNKWILEGMSETLSTFILAIFVYASGAEDVLTGGASSFPAGRALASGTGLMLAVYCGIRASGASRNPCITMMFCLSGRLPWNRLLLYTACELIGAFLAASVTFGVYYDLISSYEEGVRRVVGDGATAGIFITLPIDGLSRVTEFFDVSWVECLALQRVHNNYWSMTAVQRPRFQEL